MNLTFQYYTSYPYPEGGEREFTNYMTLLVLGAILLPLWVIQIVHEIKEISAGDDLEIMEHFTNWANQLDLVHLVMTPVMLINSCTITPLFFEQVTSNQLAAFVCFSVVAKSFDWLKLFDNTAFYILLIEKTLSGITYFLTPFWIACLMFAMPMVIMKSKCSWHRGGGLTSNARQGGSVR